MDRYRIKMQLSQISLYLSIQNKRILTLTDEFILSKNWMWNLVKIEYVALINEFNVMKIFELRIIE